MAPQARYWLLTIPHHQYAYYLPPGVVYLRGQLERGSTGYLHWQLLATFGTKVRLRAVKRVFGDSAHAEPSKSTAADAYVWKEDTSIAGTRFELGRKPTSMASKPDWDEVWKSAKSGRLIDIDAGIRVRNYQTLKRIEKDHMEPIAMERSCAVFWGSTGTGKSRRAWAEAGMGAYPKNSRTKFWDGYREHEHVVMDEFTGEIGITNLLTWLDRYPVIIETKGGAAVLRAKRIWITSNVDPHMWYNTSASPEQIEALIRRMEITYFPPSI